MIRRLTILLLIVGCAYGDTIVYKSGSKNRTIENVEYTKAGKGKVYFKAYDREVSRDCSKVVTFTDNVGNPIEYDCSAVIIEESVILDESIIEKVKTSESENYLISSGQKLIKFQSKYYRGFMIALFGQVITIVGATSTSGEIEPIIVGGVISLAGSAIMLSSFLEARRAGEDLIKAGEKLETEQEDN